VTYLRTTLSSLGRTGTFIVIAGCATSAPPPPKEPVRERPPAGPIVHVEQEGETPHGQPIGLYRIESDTASYREVSAPHVPNAVDRSPEGSRVVEDRVTIERFVCFAPCDRAMPAALFGQDLFFGGEGITSSDRFRLTPTPEPVHIRVAPGSLARRNAGTALTTTGAVGLFLGLATLPIPVANRTTSSTATSAACFGIDAALLASGIGLLLSGRTTFSFKPAWQ
jgi:hypothetical protein